MRTGQAAFLLPTEKPYDSFLTQQKEKKKHLESLACERDVTEEMLLQNQSNPPVWCEGSYKLPVEATLCDLVTVW